MKNFTLALIAHDARKEDMVQLVKAHGEDISQLSLVATRSTGQLVTGRTKLPVTLVQSGPLGGDAHSAPLATDVATAEAILHLLFEHTEVLHGHHLAAEYLEEVAAVRG